jgi:hypothetical protein
MGRSMIWAWRKSQGWAVKREFQRRDVREPADEVSIINEKIKLIFNSNLGVD